MSSRVFMFLFIPHIPFKETSNGIQLYCQRLDEGRLRFICFSDERFSIDCENLWGNRDSFSTIQFKDLSCCYGRKLCLWRNFIWEEGGHSSTPIKQNDWIIQQSILNLLRVAMGIIPLPSFVENSLTPLLSTTTTIESTVSLVEIRSRVYFWMGWFVVYFLLESNKWKLNYKSSTPLNNIDYLNLIQRFKSKVDNKIQTILSQVWNNYIDELSTPTESSNNFNFNENNSENNNDEDSEFTITATSHCSRRIDFELQQNGSLLTIAITEQDLIRTFSRFWFDGELNTQNFFDSFQFESLSLNQLEKYNHLLSTLHSQSKVLLTYGIFHSIFDPTLFRELQTLIWFLESLQLNSNSSMMKIDGSGFSILKQLCPCFSVMLDLQLYSLTSQNLSNSLKSLNSNWESKHWWDFFTIHPYHTESSFNHNDGFLNNVDTPKLIHCNQFELQMNEWFINSSNTITNHWIALEKLNLNSLNLSIGSSDLINQMITNDSSCITVSTFRETKKRMVEVYQQIIQNSNELTHSFTNECGECDVWRWSLLVFPLFVLLYLFES